MTDLFDAWSMRRFCCTVLLSGLAALVGCGETHTGPSVHPVSGKVLYRGAPAAGATVVFYAAEGPNAAVPIPQGVTKDDGSFSLTSYEGADGAPAGQYKVTVVWKEPIPEGVNAEMYSPKDRLNGRYADPARSGLQATVTEGRNELPPFELN